MQVLIVDDDHDMRAALSETLEMEGHKTKCVANGQEALDHLRTGETPCVILLDLMMPVMNGWQFREHQLGDEALAAIPLVVITADGNAARKARDLSADGFLQKPLRPDELLATVAKYCSDPV